MPTAIIKPRVIIGKRVTVGAAILGVANALVHFYPEQAGAILAIATPVIFVVQLFIARYAGITDA